MALSLGSGCAKKSTEPPKPPAPPTKAPDVNKPSVSDKPAAKPAVEADKPAAPVANAAPAASTQGMAPLNIKLPAAVSVGTPQNLSEIRNLRPLSKTPRPPFLAPAGTKLLSLNKPVTASDPNPILGELSLITDGDKAGVDGSEVQLPPGKQYVTIDLGQQSEIYAIVVWHYHKQPCVVSGVAVQISKDKDFISDVKTVFNNDDDNSLGLGIGKDQKYVESYEGELVDCLSQGSPRGRYVRLYSNGCNVSQLNYYIEVEVYGKPLE